MKIQKFEVDSIDYDDKFLKGYQSTEMTCRNFFLSITNYGNIESKKMIRMACENIMERLAKLKDAVVEYEKQSDDNAKKTEGFVTILKDNIKTIIIVRGEDYTIGQLVKIAMFELDPSIGLINTPSEHPLNRTILFNIKHPQPIEILLDAIVECIKNFDKIQKYFK